MSGGWEGKKKALENWTPKSCCCFYYTSTVRSQQHPLAWHGRNGFSLPLKHHFWVGGGGRGSAAYLAAAAAAEAEATAELRSATGISLLDGAWSPLPPPPPFCCSLDAAAAAENGAPRSGRARRVHQSSTGRESGKTRGEKKTELSTPFRERPHAGFSHIDRKYWLRLLHNLEKKEKKKCSCVCVAYSGYIRKGKGGLPQTSASTAHFNNKMW